MLSYFPLDMAAAAGAAEQFKLFKHNDEKLIKAAQAASAAFNDAAADYDVAYTAANAADQRAREAYTLLTHANEKYTAALKRITEAREAIPHSAAAAGAAGGRRKSRRSKRSKRSTHKSKRRHH
jgi:hypothetical protein